MKNLKVGDVFTAVVKWEADLFVALDTYPNVKCVRLGSIWHYLNQVKKVLIEDNLVNELIKAFDAPYRIAPITDYCLTHDILKRDIGKKDRLMDRNKLFNSLGSITEKIYVLPYFQIGDVDTGLVKVNPEYYLISKSINGDAENNERGDNELMHMILYAGNLICKKDMQRIIDENLVEVVPAHFENLEILMNPEGIII